MHIFTDYASGRWWHEDGPASIVSAGSSGEKEGQPGAARRAAGSCSFCWHRPHSQPTVHPSLPRYPPLLACRRLDLHRPRGSGAHDDDQGRRRRSRHHIVSPPWFCGAATRTAGPPRQRSCWESVNSEFGPGLPPGFCWRSRRHRTQACRPACSPGCSRLTCPPSHAPAGGGSLPSANATTSPWAATAPWQQRCAATQVRVCACGTQSR